VPYPEGLLTDDELVVVDLRPHWIRLVRPAACAVVVLALAVLGVAYMPAGSLQQPAQYLVLLIAVVALAGLSVRPWLRWLSTRYVLTTARVILRTGVLTRLSRDIPLSRINDVTSEQTLVERVVGSGTLVIESAGERGQVVLYSVPHVEAVRHQLYELGDDARRGRPGA
jgi:uncharacterized membrane protein YdbT with pleckstrin-like domain